MELSISNEYYMSGFDVKFIKEKLNYAFRFNRLLFNEIDRLEKADSLDNVRSEELKQKLVEDLLRHAVSRSGFYKSLYQARENKRSPPLLEDFPVINKNDITSNARAISTVPLKFLKSADTSGTSGTPLRVYRSLYSIVRENAHVWYFRKKNGLNIGEPYISLRGALGREALSYFNKSENCLYLSSYQLSRSNILKFARLISEFRPKAITAYPSTLYTISNLFAENGINIQIPLAFTSSETLYNFQRQKIENVLGTKIFDSYGNVERTIHFGQCKYGNYHEFPLYSVNEFTQNGVITTSLINKSFPLIRYMMDDTFELASGICLCGKNFYFRSIEGRFDDVVISADGSRISGLSLAFRGINNLLYSQIVQHEINKIDVNIVTTSRFGPNDNDKLLHQLRNKVGTSITIDIRKVHQDEIIKSKSGKYQLVISKLPEWHTNM